jgi:hypothetical protein
MVINNFFQNTFTEYDSSISLSLERDPLGLQPIWTILGNNIFNGVTTSVATDIRNYTINLIHHIALHKLQLSSFWDNLRANVHGATEESLEDRLLLAMEMMLAYSAVTTNWNSSGGILGISSARKRWSESSVHNLIDLKLPPKDPIDSDYTGFVTLLVRQSGLGINGRYKGPFKKMGLTNGIKEVSRQDLNAIYDQLDDDYCKLIDCIVTFIGCSDSKDYQLNFEKAEFLEPYKYAFDKKPAISETTKNFWLAQLRIEEGSLAKFLYEGLNDKDNLNHLARDLFTKKSDDPKASSICSVEPFLVMLEYLFAALLQDVNQSLINRICMHLKKLIPQIQLPENMSPRLKQLIELAKLSPEEVPISLVQYHEQISQERQIHPWVTSKSGICVFKKTKYIDGLEDKLNKLDDDLLNIAWRRDYYLASIKQIKLGFEDKS